MTAYRLTPAAQKDLSSIWEFSEERWNVRQAETYLREIQSAIERVADDPERGRRRDEIREGYRSYSVESHVIFYLPRVDGVDVIRILHQRMDPSRHL
ncbi:type II toxin-antitoxin system RelE/ParE family toxin [Pseudolysinimonas sp.]